MSQEENIKIRGEQVVKALQKNNFQAIFAETKAAALTYILSHIPQEGSVGIGGSVTIQQLGLIPLLENKNLQILNHNKPELGPEEKQDIRRRQLLCDVFLTSTNAITEDGRLVNTDGAGNRVAAMIFGPKKVLVVAGINKIVPGIHEAYARIKSTAAPLNNARLTTTNPCVKAGKCMNCSLPTRICNVSTVLHKKPLLTDIHVVVIGEALGY